MIPEAKMVKLGLLKNEFTYLFMYTDIGLIIPIWK